MKLAAVVVVFNPEIKKLNECIDTYIQLVDKLYIIDNSETENEQLKQMSNKIEYYPNKKNVGIAKALNIAADAAIKDGYDWLLTMDQDSKFEKDNLKKLISFLKKCDKKKTGLVSPWHQTKENKKKSNQDVEKLVEVMTSGNIVNLKAYKDVGGWKEWLFIDCVDIEFCMNLNAHNYKVLRYNKSILKHNLGNIVIKKLGKKEFACTNHNYKRQYYMIRNMLYLRDMYQDLFPKNLYSMKRGAYGRLKNILVWEKDKYRKIRNMYRGYKDYKKGIKGIYPYNN